MKNTTYLLLLFTFCCFACNKDNPDNTRIIDAATKEPIPNATVGLFEKESNGFFSPPSRSLVETVVTDEEGVYNFTHSLSGDRTYDVSVDADTYWQSTRNSYPSNPTIEMDPEGYVKVKVRKVDTTEYARVNINDGLVISFSGQKVDTSFISKQRGNLSHQYVWFIYNNSGELINNTRGENFYVPPHDTTTFEIIF